MALSQPARGMGMIWEGQPGADEASSFGEQMVVVLGAGIGEADGDAGGMGGQAGRKQGTAFTGGCGGISEERISEEEADEAQGHFLGGGPMGAEVGRIKAAEGFKAVPKIFGVFFFSAEVVCAGQGGGSAKTAHFPERFDTAASGE